MLTLPHRPPKGVAEWQPKTAAEVAELTLDPEDAVAL
jgi:hypothetical protein